MSTKDSESQAVTMAVMRAKRLLLLREMTGLSRDALQKRYKIARGTLQNWESARFGGLTVKGAVQMVKLYQAEGIACSKDWLLHGVGAHPILSRDNHLEAARSKVINALHNANNSEVTKEILYFRKHNSNAIDIVITDDAMLPWYKPGDIVMGVRYFNQAINKLIGKICIVQVEGYGNILRLVQAGSREGIYNLQAVNIHRMNIPSCIADVNIISAAEVVWVRSTHFSLHE